MESVTFNGEEYLFECKLFKFTKNLDIDTNFEDSQVLFDFINFLHIEHDLYSPFPTIEISIKDPSTRYINKYLPNGQFGIEVTLIYSKNEDEDNIDDSSDTIEYYFSHLFIIDDVIITEETNEDTTYLIKGSSILKPFMNCKLWYSTGDLPQPITKIIENIFSQQIGSEKFEIFKINEELTHCKALLNYITPINWTLQDNYDYLIQLISSKSIEDGPYFLAYNILENSLKLYSFKDEFKRNLKNFNAVKLSSKYGFSDKLEYMPHNLIQNNFINGSNMVFLNKEFKVYDFSQHDRAWYNKVYTLIDFQNYIKPKDEPDLEDKFQLFLNENINEFYKNRSNFQEILTDYTGHRKVGDNIFNAFYFMNAIQLTTQGYIPRDINQNFVITLDNPSDSKFIKYYGKWFIVRIKHKFTKNQYLQDVNLIRPNILDYSLVKSTFEEYAEDEFESFEDLDLLNNEFEVFDLNDYQNINILENNQLDNSVSAMIKRV